MLILLAAAFAGAAGYVSVCARLVDRGASPADEAP